MAREGLSLACGHRRRGRSLTDTAGNIQTVVETDFVGSATLVAVTVTPRRDVIAEGAVNRPVWSIVPNKGLSDQVTDVSAPGARFTSAANSCV
jgi:hypothetical protein